jgi:ribosome-associated protein
VPPRRKATRPTQGSQRRRIEGKVRRGQVKAARRRVVE